MTTRAREKNSGLTVGEFESLPHCTVEIKKILIGVIHENSENSENSDKKMN